MHLLEMEAAKAGMPVVCVNHDQVEGATVKDIHMENFNVSVGGRDLIVDGSVTLSFGRHYGQFVLETLTIFLLCFYTKSSDISSVSRSGWKKWYRKNHLPEVHGYACH